MSRSVSLHRCEMFIELTNYALRLRHDSVFSISRLNVKLTFCN